MVTAPAPAGIVSDFGLQHTPDRRPMSFFPVLAFPPVFLLPRLGMSLRACCPLGRGAEAFVEAHLQRVTLLRAQGR